MCHIKVNVALSSYKYRASFMCEKKTYFVAISDEGWATPNDEGKENFRIKLKWLSSKNA